MSLRKPSEFGRSRYFDRWGSKVGVKSFGPDELQRARQRIKDLESDLELVKAASALFNAEEVVLPKSLARSSMGYATWASPGCGVSCRRSQAHHVPPATLPSPL